MENQIKTFITSAQVEKDHYTQLVPARPLPGLEEGGGEMLGEWNVVEPGPGGGQAVGPVEGEFVRAVVGQAGHARPALLGRGPHHPEYLTQQS